MQNSIPELPLSFGDILLVLRQADVRVKNWNNLMGCFDFKYVVIFLPIKLS